MGYRAIALDVGQEKKEYCLDLGAEVFVDVTEEQDVANALKRFTKGKLANVVLVTVGVGVAYQSAFDLLAPFATLMCVGIPPLD